jgi:MFS transporter, FHS family, L-fucose permease
MSIVGAAVVPAVQGYVSDLFDSMQFAFLVPMACFIYVGFYFFGEMKRNAVQNAEEPLKMAR